MVVDERGLDAVRGQTGYMRRAIEEELKRRNKNGSSQIRD
jgi:hypothetical protein